MIVYDKDAMAKTLIEIWDHAKFMRETASDDTWHGWDHVVKLASVGLGHKETSEEES